MDENEGTNNSMPEPEEWSHDDMGAAEAEGWGFFDSDGSNNGRCQLCRIDTNDFGPQLDSDDDAWKIVLNGALAGNPLHQRAMLIVARHNAIEFGSMCKFAKANEIPYPPAPAA